MATVYDWLLDGSRATKKNKGYDDTERIILVDGLTETGQDAFEAAIDAVNTASPTATIDYDDAHPDLPDLYVEYVECEGLKGAVKLRVHYRSKDSGGGGGTGESASATISVGTVLEQSISNTDYKGTLLDVPADNANSTRVPATAQVLMPKTTLTFTRTESADPAEKSMDYVGKVNSGAWTNVEPSASARVWLCTGIVGNSSDGGNSYSVQYSFARAEQVTVGGNTYEKTWDAWIYYTDPTTGKPPDWAGDIVWSTGVGSTGDGYTRWQMYDTADFSALSLIPN